MSDVGLFIAGCIVTAIVVAGIAALFYAAVLDGRIEERRRSAGVQDDRGSGNRSRSG
jgi:hypothetical protein